MKTSKHYVADFHEPPRNNSERLENLEYCLGEIIVLLSGITVLMQDELNRQRALRPSGAASKDAAG